MKPAVIALLLSLAIGVASAAAAGERNPTHLFDPGNHVDAAGVVRDRGDRPVGRIEEDVKGSHVLRDNAGRHIGSVERGFAEGELVVRDSEGRRQGTLERRTLERRE
ncbi:hypothetical protein [Azospirillum himalayense]|uniref:Uncharacterized protein n=1 Tax=Azospirillum himalayense TaxID=654847 RepID=A0ABW0G3G9_9PROT